MSPSHDPLVPPPAGRLAARYARRIRTLAGGAGRLGDAAARRLGGSTAADRADSLRWAKPDRLSARRTSPR